MPVTLRRGAVPGIAGEYGNQAYCHYVDGSLREGQADAEIAVQMIAELDIAVPISIWTGALLLCLTARGELAAAEAALDEVWAGREIVPGFPGAHSQGETLDELQANLAEVIAMLLEDGEPRFESEFIGTQSVQVA